MSDAPRSSVPPSTEAVSPAWPPGPVVDRTPFKGHASPRDAAAPPAEASIGDSALRSGSVAAAVAGTPESCPSSDEDARSAPTYVFFAVVSSVVLLIDVLTKAWAEIRFEAVPRVGRAVTVIDGHLSLTLAYNEGGAWGLFRDFGDWIRKPFFPLVSALAIAFLVSLYGRLRPEQTILKWGLPLVLGGALGNLSDRITRQGVVDFIDFRADWVATMNRAVAAVHSGWTITDHWPTFNVADIGISVGVVLMALDMLLAKREDAVAPANGVDAASAQTASTTSSSDSAEADGAPGTASGAGRSGGAEEAPIPFGQAVKGSPTSR